MTYMQEIKTTQLVKQYQNLTAVDKLGLEIQQGELFSLLGVNGAGKTTVKLLRNSVFWIVLVLQLICVILCVVVIILQSHDDFSVKKACLLVMIE